MEEIIPGSNTFCIREDDQSEEPDRRGLGYVFYHSMIKFKDNAAQVSKKDFFTGLFIKLE